MRAPSPHSSIGPTGGHMTASLCCRGHDYSTVSSPQAQVCCSSSSHSMRNVRSQNASGKCIFLTPDERNVSNLGRHFLPGSTAEIPSSHCFVEMSQQFRMTAHGKYFCIACALHSLAVRHSNAAHIFHACSQFASEKCLTHLNNFANISICCDFSRRRRCGLFIAGRRRTKTKTKKKNRVNDCHREQIVR